MPQLPEPLTHAFTFQAKAAQFLGSPFSAAMLEAFRQGLEEDEALFALAAPFLEMDVKTAMDAAVPLRFLGFAHQISLSGEDAALSGLYPPNPVPEIAALVPQVKKLAQTRFDAFADFLKSPPQTNEVGRSLALRSGFAVITAATGLPLRTFEIGASAGLNLNWDLFFYLLGETASEGDPDSPVVIDGVWEGPLPPRGPIEVLSRRGCDIAPIDVADPAAALRLQAYCWADQELRLVRLRGAITLRRAHPDHAPLDRADAADWVETHISPRTGCVTVLCHSIMWAYLPSAVQNRITAHMEAVGRAATPEAPIAWLSFEQGAQMKARPDITLRLWPQAPGPRILGECHPHGGHMVWAG